MRIGRLAGVRVQVSHVKASGRGNWGKQVSSLALIESARRDGVEVLGDAYPYTAYSTGLTVTFPGWALEGGREAILERLRGAERERIRREVDDYVRNADPGDYELVVIASVVTERNRRFVGKNLAEVAATWKVDPAEALLRIVDEEQTSVSYIGHGMSPENVERVLGHPLVMIGSDGHVLARGGTGPGDAAASPLLRLLSARARATTPASATCSASRPPSASPRACPPTRPASPTGGGSPGARRPTSWPSTQPR